MAPLVYVVGDSISIQYGPYLEEALAGKCRYARKSGEAEALLNLDVPMGANAGDSSRVLEFLRGMVAGGHFQPDLLLVNCGLHDIKRNPSNGTIQVPLGEYLRNLRQIVALTREARLSLAWVRTTPVVDHIHNSRVAEFHRYARDLEAYNAGADTEMAAGGIPVLDLHAFTRGLGSDAEIFCDHVHFSEPIRKRQGAYLAECLIRLMPGASPLHRKVNLL